MSQSASSSQPSPRPAPAFAARPAVRGTVVANGETIEALLPCPLEEFLRSQNLLPRSVVVEHNGEAVAPSEFAGRLVRSGDRLEIVRIVAGG